MLYFIASVLLWFSCTRTTQPEAKNEIPHNYLPPQTQRNPTIQAQLTAAWKNRSADYKPRTKHLLTNGQPKYINRLLLETSPYLKQHAHNPVDWRPWNQESLAEAHQKQKPIFLSVGYATCHWCHVMEEESFEDEEIAAFLNKNYIPIKVDREERPDVDAVYMRAVYLLNGRGGWPMSVWLTADAKPFFGATYIPPRDGDRGRSEGFYSMLQRFSKLYQQDPPTIASQAERVSYQIRRSLSRTTPGNPPKSQRFASLVKQSKERFDSAHGGRKGQPKFPSGFPTSLLLQLAAYGDQEALLMAEQSLIGMREGGIYDHIGGGFHRYSVDAKWLIPHFEKMLYDNAQLAVDYLHASRLRPKHGFEHTTIDILDYILRDMTSPYGAFYSATDADSQAPSGHQEEGYYFSWTPNELAAFLPRSDVELFSQRFGVSQKGNFEKNRSVLSIKTPLSALANQFQLSETIIKQRLKMIRKKVHQKRNQRPPPLLDDKIITAWNGLMISAFAKAGFYLHEPHYIQAAARAANFIFDNMYIDGQLQRAYAAGQAKPVGFIEDHAFFMAGLLDLFEATGDTKWLKAAMNLDKAVHKDYEDANGGWYRTHQQHSNLLVRESPSHDGAEPSGASIMLHNLLRLAALTSNDWYRERSDKALHAYGKLLSTYPLSADKMMLASHWSNHPPKEIFIIADSAHQAKPLVDILRRSPIKNRVFAIVTSQQQQRILEKLIPPLHGKNMRNQRATAYVCEGGSCQFPTNTPQEFAQQLQ